MKAVMDTMILMDHVDLDHWVYGRLQLPNSKVDNQTRLSRLQVELAHPASSIFACHLSFLIVLFPVALNHILATSQVSPNTEMALTEVSSSYSCNNGEITHKTLQIRDGVEMEISFKLTYSESPIPDEDEDLLEDEDKEQLKTAYEEFISDFIDKFHSVGPQSTRKYWLRQLTSHSVREGEWEGVRSLDGLRDSAVSHCAQDRVELHTDSHRLGSREGEVSLRLQRSSRCYSASAQL